MSADEIIGLERRVRSLLDGDYGHDNEHLHAINVVSETPSGYYALVVYSWDHGEAKDARLLAERFAYLTKGDGNDGWVTDADNPAIIRRDDHDDPGALAASLAKTYAAVAARQRRDDTADADPHVGAVEE